MTTNGFDQSDNYCTLTVSKNTNIQRMRPMYSQKLTAQYQWKASVKQTKQMILQSPMQIA